MNELIKVILSLSVSGTLLFFLILGLKQLYKNKFSRRWQYYIWIIVVLRFLLPFAPDTINIGSLFGRVPTTVLSNENFENSEKPVNPSVPTIINTNGNEPKQLQIPANKNTIDNNGAQKTVPLYFYLFFVWLALALILFIRKITIYQGFIQYIRAGNKEVSDIKTLNLLSECAEKLNIKARVELCRNTMISSPIMIGFLRPNIILPDVKLEDKALSFIFMHELHHYKQRDMFYKWLIQFVICIHWFNPFVYLLEKEVNKASELSCDEAVIALLDDNAKHAYGDTLISFLWSNQTSKGTLASVTLTEGAEQLKERLGAIMYFRRKTKAIGILSGILTGCIILGAAFIPVYSVTAAIDSTAAKTSSSASKLPVPEAKGDRSDTYIYDENLDAGWYLDDNYNSDYNDLNINQNIGTWNNNWDWADESNWDWADESNWDWADESNWDWADESNWDWANESNWDWDDDKEFAEMYAAYGFEKKGKSIYYQGELLYIFCDERSHLSYYLEMNPQGTASIRIVRDNEGKITGAAYMTTEEIEELCGAPFVRRENVSLINTSEWDSSSLSTIEAYYAVDNIYILPSPTDKVVLKEYLTENQPDYCASVETKKNVLTIRAGNRPKTNFQSSIEIYVPNTLLNNVKIETVSGGITVNNYTGVLGLSTISGLVEVWDSNIAGNIDTISGEVKLYPAGLLGDLAVYSISGKIDADFAEAGSLNLIAKTVSGKIKSSNFEISPQNEKYFGRIVGSSPEFTTTLETVSGTIYID